MVAVAVVPLRAACTQRWCCSCGCAVFCLCVGGGCARRLLTCAQCVPLARPGFGTGWFCARVGECISAAWQRLGLCSLHLLGRAFARIMPYASLPLSLCVCRQLPDSCCFCGMLHLGRWGQPPVMQVRGLNPRIDVGHVTLPSSSSPHVTPSLSTCHCLSVHM